jgi:hypothetical protein
MHIHRPPYQQDGIPLTASTIQAFLQVRQGEAGVGCQLEGKAISKLPGGASYQAWQSRLRGHAICQFIAENLQRWSGADNLWLSSCH